jgi:hydrogenase 3 maturation protease
MKRMLLGVGNRLSHDDGAGPAVARALHDSDWMAVDCGTSFENAAGLVARERPDLLVIVDAAHMGSSPGTVLRLAVDAQDSMLASTHGLPLSFVLEHVRSFANSTVLIGIEPADLSFGEGLSPEVGAATRRLVGLLRGEDLSKIPAHNAAPEA